MIRAIVGEVYSKVINAICKPLGYSVYVHVDLGFEGRGGGTQLIKSIVYPDLQLCVYLVNKCYNVSGAVVLDFPQNLSHA